MVQVKYPQTSNQTDKFESPLISRIENKVEKSIAYTSSWENKQEKFHKMRMRIKKPKTFPFIGSSNLRMPTAETKIRKTKAALLSTLFGLRPIVQVIPSPGASLQEAVKLEKFLDHIVMDVMNLPEKATIAIDQSLEKGFYLLKPHWRLDINEREETIDIGEYTIEEVGLIRELDEAEIVNFIIQRLQVDLNENVADDNIDVLSDVVEQIKAGKKKVTFKVKDVVYNFPDVALVQPERCYVPSSSGYEPQNCEYIVHEFFVSREMVYQNIETKGWNADVVNEILDKAQTDIDDKAIDQDKDQREGIETFQKSGLIKIREFYGWEDIDGDGKSEKVIVTYCPDFGGELKKVRLDSFSMRYPFVKLFFELTDDRWFSHRGVVEIMEDIIREIDVQHNMKVDQQTIRNAPMFVYRAGMVKPNMVQMRPNQGIPVKGTQALGDTIQALNFNNPNVEFSYEREQQILQGEIQELLGQTDYTLQSRINRREPRTLGEVQLQAQANANVFSMDAKMFTDQFSKLFDMILELWSQFGPDEYEFVYFGGNNGGETIKLTKEEIQNKYTLKVRGNDQNVNPNVRIQKAQQILSAVTNPLLIQTGLVGPAQIAEGLRRFYESLDIENADMLINAQPQPVQDTSEVDKKRLDTVKKVYGDMTNAEKIQVLSQLGIQPDLAGRSADAELDVATKEAELLEKVVETMGG